MGVIIDSVWPPRESPEACARGAVAKFMVEQRAQEVQQIFRAAAKAAAEAPDDAHQEAAAAAAAHAEITVPGPAVGEFSTPTAFPRLSEGESSLGRKTASTPSSCVSHLGLGVEWLCPVFMQGRGQLQAPSSGVPAALLCVLSVLQVRHWVSSGSGSGCTTHK
jgi:hypothetical protein